MYIKRFPGCVPLFLAMICLASPVEGSAQSARLEGVAGSAVTSLRSPRVRAVTPSLAQVERALGKRLRDTTKARMVLSGLITRQAGSTPATIVWEMPGKLFVSLGAASPSNLQFDPSSDLAQVSRSKEEAQIFDSLYVDLPETFLADTSEGAAYRYLGGRFRLDDGSDPTYPGPYLNVYQLFPRAGKRLKAADSAFARFYRFDSETGLPHSVIYSQGSDSNPIRVETRFLDWVSINGETVPKVIVRTENGQEVLRFTTGEVSFLPAVK